MVTTEYHYALPSRISSLMARNRTSDVLNKLSEITANVDLRNVLFPDYISGCQKYVRYFRIQFLIDKRMYQEAYAWCCYETELFPENMEILPLKQWVKKRLIAPTELPDKDEQEKDDKWKDVAGMFELKAIIERDIIRPIKDWKLYSRFRVNIPRSFMLYGPPGCGKTYFARKIADRLGFNFYEIHPSDIGSIYVHGGQTQIRDIFIKARKNRPAVLFFDEIEAFAPNREEAGLHHHYRSELNELLTQLDKNRNKRMIIIGATNYLRNIDKAVLRPGRFDKKIFVGPPDAAARADAFKQYLRDIPQDFIKYELVSEFAEHFTFAEIEAVCTAVKQEAIDRKKPINTDMVCSIVNNYMPALNKEKLNQYYN